MNADIERLYAIVETMKTLKMSCPEPTEAHREELPQESALAREGGQDLNPATGQRVR